MGTDVDQERPPSPPRAGAVPVMLTMAAVATISVAAVVAWARLSTGRTGADPSGQAIVDDVPVSLAGGVEPGAVPDAVVAAVDLPVVGARQLEELPDDSAADCRQHGEFDEEPTLEYAVATPEGIAASLVGPSSMMGVDIGGGGADPPLLRLRCTVEFSDDRWHGASSSSGPAGDEVVPSGSSFSCCDARGFATASATIATNPDASWALQDRGSWYLAYPLSDRGWTEVTWTFRENRFGQGRPPSSNVLFVDDTGAVVGETNAGDLF